MSKQILLIDDSATQLRVREAILRDAGFVVAVATTSESALALLRSSPALFGLVITDHLLHGVTGVDIVRQLRTFLPEIPVIVISGMPELDEEYEGLNVIIRQKPLPPPELIDLARTRLRAA
jgi:DNA-binding response OmpR family regulator